MAGPFGVTELLRQASALGSMNRSLRLCVASLTLSTVSALAAACGSSSAPSPAAVAAQLTSLAGEQSAVNSAVQAGSGAGAASGAPTSAGAVVVMDPCQKLTKADVQPFFTVPVVNELPEPYNTATTKACSFSAAGVIGTTLSIKVVGGDDAQTMQTLQKADTQEVTFSGVGVTATHPHGSTEMTAQEGTDANPMYCGISTTGWKELAGKKDLADVTNIPDATATTIAQQYGTLCNKLFGTGHTTPTMTVAAPAASAGVAVPSAATGPVLATAGTIGPGFPIPQGLDCSGSKTTTTGDGTVTCDTTTTEGKAIYDYYLVTLPAKGYTINHEGEQSGASGEIIATLLFEGPGVGGFSTLGITGPDVSIMLQKG